LTEGQITANDQQESTRGSGSRIVGGFVVLCVALLAIGLAYYLGTRISDDQWPLLVTATGLSVYIAVSVNNPLHGLLFWVATAPFARFVHLNIDLGAGIPNLTLNRIMTGVLLVLLLAQVASRRRGLVRLNVLDFAILAFVGASALSVPHNIAGLRSAAQSFFDLVVMPIAVYFLARNIVTKTTELKAVMYTLIVAGTYLSAMAIREQLTGEVLFYPEGRSIYYTASIGRVVGLLGNPAYIAVSIAMGVPWAWYLFLKAKRHRLLLLGIIGTMCAGVFFCMNRSGWVGLMTSFVVMALFVKRFRGIFLMILIIVAIVAGAYWAVITSSAAVRERLTAQGPIDYRREAWTVALRMIQDYPVFGVGYDNYRHFYKQYSYWDVYLIATPTPHNTYLWVILMGGIVALAPFAFMLLTMFFSSIGIYYRSLPQRDDLPYADLTGAYIASMSTIWVPALVMDVLTGYFNMMLMFLITGAYFGVMSWERWRPRLRERRDVSQNLYRKSAA
jgi:O-antigen ligase